MINKHEALERLFRPLADFLLKHKLSSLYPILIICTIILYFVIFKKDKKDKLGLSEYIMIACWLLILILAIYEQIKLLTTK